MRYADYRTVLQEAEARGLRRRLRAADDTAHWPHVTLDGQPVVDLCSNDYLGLAQDPRLAQAAAQAAQTFGTGGRASRLVGGSDVATRVLEEALAHFTGTEAALVFASGYQANLAILQALLAPGDWAFCDRLNHASLNDGVRLSGARCKRYAHLDLEHLDRLLRAAPHTARKWVISDTVFSMEGDYPDLNRLCAIARHHGACVMLDEAHANGLFGEARHSGLAEAQGVTSAVDLQMGTFSKALGGFGAFAAGSRELMAVLVQRARGFLYTTALPPSVIAAAYEALGLVQSDPTPLARLRATQAWFIPALQQTLAQAGLSCPSSHTPIVPIICPGRAQALSQALYRAGYHVGAIRPPTVPAGTERLRLCLSAAHTHADLRGFLEALAQALTHLPTGAVL